LRTTGTSKTRAAFDSATLLLITVWRSKFATPKSICGWRSMIATTQLSGVSNPFSLRLARALGCGIRFSLGLIFRVASNHLARFLERQARRARVELGRVAVGEVA